MTWLKDPSSDWLLAAKVVPNTLLDHGVFRKKKFVVLINQLLYLISDKKKKEKTEKEGEWARPQSAIS
jgi:hypothetical protein